MTYLIGVDIGTSGTKTILIDETGHVHAVRWKSIPFIPPGPSGRSRSLPIGGPRPAAPPSVRCWNVRRRCQGGEGRSGCPVRCTAPSFWMRTRRCCGRALLWNDQRTQAECDWIMETVGERRSSN